MNEAPCGYDHAPSGSTLLVRHGPSLKVDLGFDPDFVTGFGDFPKPGMKGLDALIDTGAHDTYIDRSLVAELGLPLIDQDIVGTATGTERVNIHLAQIHVIALGSLILGRIAAVGLRENGFEFDVLLGRTFLQNYVFTYDGPTRLSWSQEKGELKSVDGSWELEDLGGDRTRATYRLEVDLGRMLSLVIRGPLVDLLRDMLVGARAGELKQRIEGGSS